MAEKLDRFAPILRETKLRVQEPALRLTGDPHVDKVCLVVGPNTVILFLENATTQRRTSFYSILDCHTVRPCPLSIYGFEVKGRVKG